MNTRVLLVDDEESFTEVLSERLRNRKLEVDTAASGPEALKYVDSKDYDAVVLDLAMPEMDGLETLQRLLKRNPDLQVIILTGYGTVKDGVKAIQDGAMEFLEKPVDLEKLTQKIAQAQIQRVVITEKRMEATMTDILRSKGW
ncbi:MAG: response regulator [Calditrichota bacterium]